MLGLGEQRWLVDVTRHPGSCRLEALTMRDRRWRMHCLLTVWLDGTGHI